MTLEEAIAELDAMRGNDIESEHGRADEIATSFLPPLLVDAILRAEQRAGGWWWA